jgi:hypothetical protein
MPAWGGEAMQVTDNGGFEPLDSADGKTLYYTKDYRSPLFARPISGGPERKVLDLVFLSSFVPVDDGIYYVHHPDRKRRDPLELRFYDFATGRSRVLEKFAAAGGQGLTVSPDRKTFLYSVFNTVYADLTLVENFR